MYLALLSVTCSSYAACLVFHSQTKNVCVGIDSLHTPYQFNHNKQSKSHI